MQLKKCQIQYYPDNLILISFFVFLACSNVPHFSTKKESVIVLKMTNVRKKNVVIFNDAKKNKDLFSQ